MEISSQGFILSGRHTSLGIKKVKFSESSNANFAQKFLFRFYTNIGQISNFNFDFKILPWNEIMAILTFGGG